MYYLTSDKRLVPVEYVQVVNDGSVRGVSVETDYLDTTLDHAVVLEKFNSRAEAERFIEFLYENILRDRKATSWQQFKDWTPPTKAPKEPSISEQREMGVR